MEMVAISICCCSNIPLCTTTSERRLEKRIWKQTKFENLHVVWVNRRFLTSSIFTLASFATDSIIIIYQYGTLFTYVPTTFSYYDILPSFFFKGNHRITYRLVCSWSIWSFGRWHDRHVATCSFFYYVSFFANCWLKRAWMSPRHQRRRRHQSIARDECETRDSILLLFSVYLRCSCRKLIEKKIARRIW